MSEDLKFTYTEHGRVLAEFTSAQELFDFAIARARRQWEADYIISQRKRDNRLKLKWWILGTLTTAGGELFSHIIKHHL